MNLPPKVDLYNHAYGSDAADAYRLVRIETYGEDFGQTSWVTNEESAEIPQLLALNRNSYALEIGCGSGEYALHLVEKLGCQIVGLDINESGIRHANQLAQAKSLASRTRFEQRDVSQGLPFDADTFDAAFSNDVLCHIPARSALLAEMFRVLKPGGRVLFSDALVIGGMISDEEIATRSSIGIYVYSPPGENERLMDKAAFRQIVARDTTENAARIATRRCAAREKRKDALVAAEGDANFAGVQEFLQCVRTLTGERRLLRYLYTAIKPQ